MDTHWYRAVMIERQRLLIREANHYRALLGLPLVVGLLTDLQEPVPDARSTLSDVQLALVEAVEAVVARKEELSWTTLLLRSGLARRTFARTLAWAVDAQVLERSGKVYAPGTAWLVFCVAEQVPEASGGGGTTGTITLAQAVDGRALRR